MTNQEITRLLRNIAAAYTIEDENKYRFQIIAYQRAADSIDHLSIELKDLFQEKKHKKIPGIGPGIASHIEELLKKGKVAHFQEVMKGIPKAVFSLIDVPTFGPKKAYRLVKEFNIHDEGDVLTHVLHLAKKGKISQLEGFGDKSEADIIRAIEEYRLGKTKSNRMVLPYAFEFSRKIIEYMKKCKAVLEVQPLGSLRRMVATVGDIDIAVASNNAKAVIEHFTSYRNTERVIERGDVTASILIQGGRQIDLMIQKPESFGSLLQHFTGSKQHNVALREYALKKGMSLSEYGIKVKSKDETNTKKFRKEEEFYKFLGLDWIPPELRENQGEIELALHSAQGKLPSLPTLVDLKDIKGDLHIHSDYPIEPSHDFGINSMEEIIQKAVELKYEYIGFSEHNPSITNHSKNEIYKVLLERSKKIEQLKKSKKNIRAINLLEVDILASGELAIDEKSLDLIDAALVSIHSSFSMDKKRMTQRVIKGFSHQKAKILSHPTGRLLNERAGYEVEWDRLFDFVVKHNKALEINAWPTRLDLPDTLVRQAKEKGVRFVIDTDSHAVSQMDNMFYGVAVAQRGWCTKDDILNTLEYNEFIEWLKK